MTPDLMQIREIVIRHLEGSNYFEHVWGCVLGNDTHLVIFVQTGAVITEIKMPIQEWRDVVELRGVRAPMAAFTILDRIATHFRDVTAYLDHLTLLNSLAYQAFGANFGRAGLL